MTLSKAEASRVEKKILSLITIDANGCWLFPFVHQKSGYGQMWLRRDDGSRKNYRTHRLMLCVRRGPLHADALHRCNVKACCNPDHLYEGSDADNARDRRESAVPYWNKISDDQVRELRRRFAAGESPKVLAEAFGIHRVTVYKIGNGYYRRHVSPS